MPGPDRPLEGFGAQDGIDLAQRTALFRGVTVDETDRLRRANAYLPPDQRLAQGVQ